MIGVSIVISLKIVRSLKHVPLYWISRKEKRQIGRSDESNGCSINRCHIPFVCHLLFLLNRLGFYLSMQCTRPTGAIFHPREWTMPTKINYATSFWTVLCYSIMYPRSSCNNLRHVTCNLQRKEVSSLKLTKNTQTDSNYVASIKWPFNCNTIFTVSSMLLA